MSSPESRYERFARVAELRHSEAWKTTFPPLGEIPPFLDHVLLWRDRKGTLLITSEPYPSMDGHTALMAWTRSRGLQIASLPCQYGLWAPSDNTGHSPVISFISKDVSTVLAAALKWKQAVDEERS